MLKDYLFKIREMKILSYVLLTIAVLLIVFNLTQIDYSHPLEGNSSVALIGVVAGLCAIVLLVIFRMSKSIDEKIK